MHKKDSYSIEISLHKRDPYGIGVFLYTLIPTPEYLLDSYCHCGAQTGVAKHVLAFVSLCGARTRVRESLLAFYSLWTGLVIVTSNVYGVFV